MLLVVCSQNNSTIILNNTQTPIILNSTTRSIKSTESFIAYEKSFDKFEGFFDKNDLDFLGLSFQQENQSQKEDILNLFGD